jgi:hypothetical protein
MNTVEFALVTIDVIEAGRNGIDYKLSDVADSITYIPVESFIGDYVTSLNANVLKISSNYIASENFPFGGDLVLYDRNGKFIRKIAQKGDGPGEYKSIRDVAIDEENALIYVLSHHPNKVFKYSLEGVFERIIDLPARADKIAVSPSGRLLVHFPNWMGNLQYSCLLFDNKSDIVGKLKNNILYELGAGRSRWFDEGCYYIYNDRIHIKGVCDTLYVIENDRFIPKYVFDTGDNHSNRMTQAEYDGKIRFYYIFETDLRILFSFRSGESWYVGYYDKAHRKTFFASTPLINNDMEDRDTFRFLYSDYQYNDMIIQRRRSEFDRERLKKNVSPSKYLEIIDMLDRLKEKDDDPVILSVLHLKNSRE